MFHFSPGIGWTNEVIAIEEECYQIGWANVIG